LRFDSADSSIQKSPFLEAEVTVMFTLRRILHPTDFSEQSEAAFRLAASLARDHGARLTVIHVVQPPTLYAAEGLVIVPTLDLEPIREQLARIQAKDPLVSVEHVLVEGDPAAEILKAASEYKCDLIVIGTHGRTGLGRMLMGSVAENVVRKATCPVLTLKTPPRTPQCEEALATAESNHPSIALAGTGG
jgi:universal stress protein A